MLSRSAIVTLPVTRAASKLMSRINGLLHVEFVPLIDPISFMLSPFMCCNILWLHFTESQSVDCRESIRL